VSDPWGQPQQQQSGGDWSVPQGGESGSGSFAPPPVDPQYGAAPQYGGQPQQGQPQYGAPQYGGQPYGAPQDQYGQVPPAGYGYPAAPQKNGFAVAGLVLSILPLLGLIFSILGLNRAGKVGGKGKGLAIAGLVLSIAIGAGYTALAVNVGNSTALDPGCTSAESSISALDSKLEADGTKISSDAGNPATMQADLATLTTDLQSVKSALDTALAKAKHQSVKDGIQAVDTDITTVLSGVQALSKGDLSQADSFETAAQKVETDGTALDNLCSSL
jgi:hypothetical protein